LGHAAFFGLLYQLFAVAIAGDWSDVTAHLKSGNFELIVSALIQLSAMPLVFVAGAAAFNLISRLSFARRQNSN